MRDAVNLLDQLLRDNEAGSIVLIHVEEVCKLGSLGRFNLGRLSETGRHIGIVAALQRDGLFGRKVVVLPERSK